MFAETRYEHIVRNERDEPQIAGTNMKIKELVAERLAWGWSPEELQLNHPDLSLGQIFSALAYYADHSEEIDEAIAADLALMDGLRGGRAVAPGRSFEVDPVDRTVLTLYLLLPATAAQPIV